jgi:alpha-mannosidase
VAADLDRVDVHVEGSNTAEDHRLRLHLRAPFRATRFEVESAFETVLRPIAPPPDAFGPGHPTELPIGAVPQRSFSAISDGSRTLTVATQGSPEVEAVPEADGSTSLAVTLLRSVGWLSGSDLRSRPGPAGPVFPTPGAQVPGPFHAALSLRLHAESDPDRVAHAHRFAHPAAGFVPGEGRGAAIRDGERLVEIDDPQVVISAIEPGADGGLALRLYEASGSPRRVHGRIPGARRIRAVDLVGNPDAAPALTTTGDRFELDLRASAIVDLEVAFSPDAA